MKLAFMELETSHVVYDVLALTDNGVVLFTAPADSDDEDVDCVVGYDLKTRVEVELMVSNRSRVLWLRSNCRYGDYSYSHLSLFKHLVSKSDAWIAYVLDERERSSAMADDVPEEVVTDILARLSVKEIVKCRSVCKSWYSLISSSFFKSYHLNKSAARNRSLALVRDGIDKERTEHYSLYLDDDDFLTTPVLELDCPFKAISRISYTEILGCCNGVVCFIDETLKNDNNRAALWNPSIRKLVEVPPPIVDSRLGGPDRASVGFGYDAVNDDYKLVRVSVDASMVRLIEVYSLRYGAWRMVDSQLNSFIGSSSVHVDGACYWLGSRQDPRAAELVVSSMRCSTNFLFRMTCPQEEAFWTLQFYGRDHFVWWCKAM
ncbi:F-box protein CPR1 [Linum perenne]